MFAYTGYCGYNCYLHHLFPAICFQLSCHFLRCQVRQMSQILHTNMLYKPDTVSLIWGAV